MYEESKRKPPYLDTWFHTHVSVLNYVTQGGVDAVVMNISTAVT